METPIGKYTSKHTNRNVAFGKNYKSNNIIRRIKIEQNTNWEIQVGKYTSKIYNSEDTRRKIQVGKYKSNKYSSGSSNQQIQIVKYKSGNINRKMQFKNIKVGK